MALHVTSGVSTIFIFLFITVLATRVRQDKLVIVRLLDLGAVAKILRHPRFGVSIVAVGTSPGLEGGVSLTFLFFLFLVL